LIVFLWCLYEIFSLKCIYRKPRYIMWDLYCTILNNPSKLYWIRIQMSGAYTMVHHADLNIGSELKRVPNANHFIYVANHIYLCYKTYISRVLLMNIFKQAHPSGYLNFPIVNFPFICINIPAYGVNIPQLVQYSRVCCSYHEFLDRGLLLTRNLLNQASYWLSWSHHFESFTVATMTWLTIT
jgi:hypothetical protein